MHKTCIRIHIFPLTPAQGQASTYFTPKLEIVEGCPVLHLLVHVTSGEKKTCCDLDLGPANLLRAAEPPPSVSLSPSVCLPVCLSLHHLHIFDPLAVPTCYLSPSSIFYHVNILIERGKEDGVSIKCAQMKVHPYTMFL